MRKPHVFLVMPFYGRVEPGAARGKYVGATDGRLQLIHHETGTSSPPHTFDCLWADALNARSSIPGGIDFFAMIHQDIIPERFWLDRLHEEIVRLKADVVSAVIPIKNQDGFCSTGIQNKDGRKRFTMHELAGLPATFDAASAGFPGSTLLINTGLWIGDFRKPWVEQINFRHETRIEKLPDGKFKAHLEPEDWLFSRDVQDLGGKVYATRKIKAAHKGDWDFTNWDVWGAHQRDPEYAADEPAKQKPPIRAHFFQSIPGWFDDNFQAVYRQAVEKAPSPARFVEVGSWLGRSTAFLAVEIANSDKTITVDAVDTWQGSPSEPDQQEFVKQHGGSIQHLFVTNMERGGVSEIIRTVPCDSILAAETMGKACHFIFIDGDHEASSVLADLRAWWPKVEPGGTLAGHDYNYPSVKASVDGFFGGLGIEVEDRVTCWLARKP